MIPELRDATGPSAIQEWLIMAQHRDQRLRGCRVLIIEDEYFLANDLEMAFRGKEPR